MMDYTLHRSSRTCAKLERPLEPGETVYSTLEVEGSEVVRRDYCAEAWQGPPEGSIGWWKSVVPNRKSKKRHWAPNDVMLDLFEELGEREQLADMRYVLGLLLVRRRVMRLEESDDPAGSEKLVLYCPRNEQSYETPVVEPTPERIAEIQEALGRLLFADSD